MKKLLAIGFALLLFTWVFALNIVTTINPYYLIVKQIVGEKSDVSLLIKPGSDPHTFNPTISDVKALSKADLIVANGLGLDNAYLKNYRNVLFVGERIPAKYLVESGEEDGHDGKTFNPHVWLSIDFLTDYIIPTIRDELVRMDKQNAKIYDKNAGVIINSLKEVSKKFDQLLKDKKGAVVILEHPSYVYLFKKYGIQVLALEEGHGKEPSAGHLKNVIELAKKSNLIGVFVGPQFKAEAIRVVSSELERQYKILDPLGSKAKTISDLFENAYNSIKEAVYGK
ncbi:MAG: metal ABC transporter substrate-binding protein [Fervidobacterium pennivorans]|mgnify:FL=1|uniref:metal ABC transporter substrate-binding protein n=1 Tax=Fervidobacterium sp. TaxID=1871331 RepID=UPI0025BF0391|nr:metal ABC transporter substrate-binding protein [Fervidobacterium sp.]NPU88505.1 zinc ABC transporter substrate-binding protein [Fervidobacterium sp.]